MYGSKTLYFLYFIVKAKGNPEGVMKNNGEAFVSFGSLRKVVGKTPQLLLSNCGTYGLGRKLSNIEQCKLLFSDFVLKAKKQ